MKKWEKAVCLWAPFLLGAFCIFFGLSTPEQGVELVGISVIFICSAFILMSVFCACALLCRILTLVEGRPDRVRQLQASEKK